MSLLGTVEHLAGAIGPRGSATSEEKNAADWVTAELNTLGYAPQQQPFVSATSSYWPYIYAAGAVMLSLFFFWQPQPVGAGAALVLTGVAFFSLILHLRLRENPLRWITPNDDSCNVIAKAPATAPSKPPILITANLDSPRAVRNALRPLLLLMLAGMGALLALFALGIPSMDTTLRQIALIPGAIALVVFGVMVMAQRAKFTTGANGNGSGVAVALDLACRLARAPLASRDVFVAFTGCGEINAAGLETWIRSHSHELNRAVHLALGHAGGNADLALIRSEQFTATFKSDAALIALGEKTAQASGANIQTRDFTLANGELSIGVKHGLRSIGLMRLDGAGRPSNWRAASDTTNNIDETSLQHAADFAWQFIQAIDSEA